MAKDKFHGTTQFAALPWRLSEGGTRQVMLLTSRETGRWIIPKGWPMKKRTPAEVARQEAYEEAGLIGHIVDKRPVGTFHYEKRLAKKEVLCRKPPQTSRPCRAAAALPTRRCHVSRYRRPRLTNWSFGQPAKEEPSGKKLADLILAGLSQAE
jgi:hypothetical protein